MRISWLSGGPYTRPLILAATALVSLLALALAYQAARNPAVRVGSLGDSPFIAGGFYADEPDVHFRYRWTNGSASADFPGVGDAPVVDIVVRAQGPRPSDAGKPITMSVYVGDTLYRPVGGGAVPWITLTNQVDSYTFRREGGSQGEGRPLTVRLETPTFQPKGDARQLGAKIIAVEARQDPWGANGPPAWMLAWIVVWVLGLAGLFSPLPRLFAVLATLVCGLLPALLYTQWPLQVAVYLPPAAAFLALAGLLVWQWERLVRWPEFLDHLRSGTWAPIAMGAAMLIYAIVALWMLPRVDFIGHADYAENAVIARNLVSGKGLTVDYVAQFYTDRGSAIAHPAETWPLLQPILIAPFFALLGTATWVAKLPNLFLLLALTWAVFWAASRLWDQRAGLIAGILTLLHPYFFNAVLYPINDLAFTLIFFALAWLVWRGVAPLSPGGRFPTFSRLASFSTRNLVYIGVLSGLLIWSKPSGIVLLAGLGLWALWVWWRTPRGRTVSWRKLGLVFGTAALVLLPLALRNLIAFGVPFFSTESYDAWILRYWPYHNWEDIYKVYFGQELPHPRWIVGGKFGYQSLLDAIGTNFGWLWQKGVDSNPGSGDYIMGVLLLAGAAVGLAGGQRKAWSLYSMLGVSLGLYTLFVLLYWHFEGRYFQVAVPWLYMLFAWGIVWVWDQLRPGESEGPRPVSQSGRRSGAWRLLFLPIAVAVVIWPSMSAIAGQIQSDTNRTGFVAGMEWLRENSTPSDVIMTRDPWELNWYTGRRAVMIPNDDLATIESMARKYGATMLQLGGPVDGIDVRRCPGTTGSRPVLGGLYCGEERPGFKLVHRERGLTIYRLSLPR